MKPLFISLLSLALLMGFLGEGVLSQLPDLYIDLRLFDSQARVFYVGDLDPTGLGNAPNYYTLELGNRGVNPETVRIFFSVISDNIVFVEGRSNAFQLSPGVYIFTSSQLNTGAAAIGDQEIKIGDYKIDFGSIVNLEQKVASTGKLPAGRYEFRVELRREPPLGAPIPDQFPDDNILFITNPTTLEPLYPGARVNDQDMPQVPTTIPYFAWQSDAEFFNLYVYRKYEAENIQEVLSRDPILHLENFPGLIFQYPSETEPLLFQNALGITVGKSVGAVRLLEPGNIYYWFVEARIPSASGEIILPSDIFQFQITDRSSAKMNSDLILVYLRQILGERYDEAMDPFQGLNPSGNLMVNGTPIDIQELEKIVKQISEGKTTLQDVFTEE